VRLGKRISLLLPLVFVLSGLPVASLRTKPHVSFHALAMKAPGRLKAPIDFRTLGVSWDVHHPAPTHIRFRTSTDGHHWTNWTALDTNDNGPDGSVPHSTDPVWVGHARFADVRWSGRGARDVKLSVIDPGPDPSTPIASAEATPGMPSIITRAQWGADESLRKDPPEYAEPLQMVFIHHTATTNNYSASDSASIVRGIYEYHVKTNGWNDIGYNFLVDRYGQIFEGRYGGMTRSLVGAHTLGFNSHSTGIATIGTFNSASPPSSMMSALERLTAWRMDVAHIFPSGTTIMTSGGNPRYAQGTKVKLNTISGHRNVYDTDCPGNLLYNQLPTIRSVVTPMGDPKIYYPFATPSTITPNADGLNDFPQLSGRFSSAVSWTESVVSSGKTWFSTSGSGTSFANSWNTKDSSGNLAPDGVYSLVINAHNGNGSVSTSVPISLERFPSTAQLIAERAKNSSNGWQWNLRNSNNGGSPNKTFVYGNPKLGDYPVVGDWDGNGSTTIGIVRPDKDGHWVWYLRNSNSAGKPSITTFAYGSIRSGDFPVAGDWDGNGTFTVGVARPTGGNIEWLLRNENSAGSPDVDPFDYGTTDFGYPVTGDFGGIGATAASFAEIDPSSSHWSWNLRNMNGTGVATPFDYGNVSLGDRPIAGDWDGNGTSSAGVTRPDGSGHWSWMLENPSGVLGSRTDMTPFSYGTERTDIPVAGNWDNDSSHTVTPGIVRPVTS
jgi:hypothetical protein